MRAAEPADAVGCTDMPVNISLTNLAADLRYGDGTNAPTQPISGMLQRHLDTATLMVARYASGAPDAVANTAATRIVGYLMDSPHAAAGMRFAAILVNSGAHDVLRLWRPIDLHMDGDE